MAKVVGSILMFLSLASVTFCSEEKTEHGAAAHKTSHFKDGVHNPVFDQEALLGSHNVDDLAELEPEVRKRRLTNLAKSHDANKNGMIERDELKEWILQSFKMLDHEEAMERLGEDDDDGDGKVTFEEMLKKQYGYTKEELDEAMKEERDSEDEDDVFELIDEDKKKFVAADLDKDGMLDSSEFVAFIQPYDYPHMFGIEMEKSMKDMDKDKDGFISTEEFIGDNTDEEARLAEVTNFEELDKDKDGKLTPEELKPWVLPDNMEVANEEVDHLFQVSDIDEDGQLSIEEIVDKEDEFISSSATDYGRNLHFVKDEL